ncbi:hypothetical protein FRB94_002241 [Tulasnella sp. JGI-2019a]|nr:hypothetical protein FRB93_012489 [Tulasnella sp. JGI-2019a]KAG8987087.1 hypothetical protein FRB94_002241 [Tulasnella sp. JGI-2019a]KAG9021916.1 hypothetical protein FRB95_001166 [Tulasnella sp. JGI-2019a]
MKEVKIKMIPELDLWEEFLPWVQDLNDLICMGETLSSNIAKVIPMRLKGEV